MELVEYNNVAIFSNIKDTHEVSITNNIITIPFHEVIGTGTLAQEELKRILFLNA